METYITAEEVKRALGDLQRKGRPTAETTFSQAQLGFFCFLTVCLVILAYLHTLMVAISVIALVTIMFLVILVMKSLVTGMSAGIGMLSFTDEEVNALDEQALPIYGILVPLRGEEAVVHRLVGSLSKLRYPTDKLKVILLLEQNDPKTVDAVKRLTLPSNFHVLVLADFGPRTKPKACNYGLWYAHQLGVERIVVYDAEDRVEPDQLLKAVLAFDQATNDVWCIQARLEYYNHNQNLLTRLFSAEYVTFYNLFLPGLSAMKWLVTLGGTSNHFILERLWQLGGWDAANVTEDIDLGVWIARRGGRVQVLDSVTWEEANSQVPNWIRQRLRWIKGHMQSFAVHLKNPWQLYKDLGAVNFGVFMTLIGGTPISLLLSPLFLLMTLIYIMSRTALVTANPEWALAIQLGIERLFPPFIMYAGVLCLIFGNFAVFYYLQIGNMVRGLYGNVIWGFAAPFYWLLMSFASWRALFQLLRNPHYWEKTKHGLDVHKEEEAVSTDVVLTREVQLTGGD